MLKSVRLLKYILLCVIITSCVKNELQEGIHSFQVQDYRQAFIRLKPLAEKGQPDAEYAVGYMFYYGQGVTEDRRRAWYWINRAANANQPDALRAVKLLSRK